MSTVRPLPFPATPRLAPAHRARDTSPYATVIPITRHPNHPIHLDQALIVRVLQGDAVAIQGFEVRVTPYVENFASDPAWADYSVAFQRGMALIARDRYASLRHWKPQVRSLSQHIDYLLRRDLQEEMAQRRVTVRQSVDLSNAIKASVNDLTDTHYWILTKIIIEGVRPKRLSAMVLQCPDLKLRSAASIGSTYSRALRRLSAVCPEQYRSAVSEFIATRQRSGRYR